MFYKPLPGLNCPSIIGFRNFLVVFNRIGAWILYTIIFLYLFISMTAIWQ